jgi:FKBP-type peptidyl-prolyl cis-trans isomerase FkpA
MNEQVPGVCSIFNIYSVHMFKHTYFNLLPMKKIFIPVMAATLIFSSCLKNINEPCDYNACAKVATAGEIQVWQDHFTANAITAQQHCSGLFYEIINPGTGKSPNVCSPVTVRYKGYFTNGTVFEQLIIPVNINLRNVINGWRNGLPLIRTGGKIILYIAPSIGYGNQDVRDENGTVVIPANSFIIFEVDLDDVR